MSSNSPDSPSDPALLGSWRVMSTDMILGKTVSLIGGLPGEYVEFTPDGRYRVDLLDRRPSESRYSAVVSEPDSSLDVWNVGLESLVAQCIYQIDRDRLTVCVAGNHRQRPTEIRRDDDKLWCVITFTRAAPPKRRKRVKSEPLLKNGSLIPAAFMKAPNEESK